MPLKSFWVVGQCVRWLHLNQCIEYNTYTLSFSYPFHIFYHLDVSALHIALTVHFFFQSFFSDGKLRSRHNPPQKRSPIVLRCRMVPFHHFSRGALLMSSFTDAPKAAPGKSPPTVRHYCGLVVTRIWDSSGPNPVCVFQHHATSITSMWFTTCCKPSLWY